MKKILVFLVTCILSSATFADNLVGSVFDVSTREPIPFATVSLLSQDSVLVTGTISDENGKFCIISTPGNFILSISYVGYKTESKNLFIPMESDINVFLSQESTQLSELEVKARRPLVERQMDKIILNVSQSAFAVGSNGQDILRKAPGVSIDKDGNITVNGKSVEVYIDGRPSYLSGEQLKGMLQGTDGATIEKIEIITNPSAKYDAAGQGGIINIKTKRNMMQGLNGMISAAYGGMYYKDFAKYFQTDYASANLNYRSAKTYTNVSLTQVYADQMETYNTYSAQPIIAATDTNILAMQSNSELNMNFQYYMAKVSNDWFIDNKNTLGFILQVPIMKMAMGADSAKSWSQTRLNDIVQAESYSASSTSFFAPQHTANLNFTHVFSDSLSREITANIDYNRYNTKSVNTIRNFAIVGIPDCDVDINTKSLINIYSTKLDFQTAFWKTGMLEAGIKYALSSTDNDMMTDSLSLHTCANSVFTYQEHVAAAYLTAGKQFGTHFSAKLGLRGEYTYSYGDWTSADTSSIYSYFNIFPTAFFGYNPNDKWSMNVSYTRRIKRPSYEQLNPFVTHIDAHTYMCGNTELHPEFNHQVDLKFGWSQFISVAFNFAHTQNMLNQQPMIMPNGDLKYSWVNFGTFTTHGGNISLTEVPIVPRKKKEISNNPMAAYMPVRPWLALTLNGSYLNFISRASQGSYVQRSNYGTASATLTTYLPKDIQMSVDAYWSSPMVVGYSRQSSYFMMNFAYKESFLQNRLILSVQVQDLLRSLKWSGENYGMGENIIGTTNGTIYNQRVMLSLTYLFGKQQWYKRRNVGNMDESSRLGNTTGVGGAKR